MKRFSTTNKLLFVAFLFVALHAQAATDDASYFKGIFNQGGIEAIAAKADSIVQSEQNATSVPDVSNSFKLEIKSIINKYKARNKKFSDAAAFDISTLLHGGLFAALDQKVSNLNSADAKISAKVTDLKANNVDTSSVDSLLKGAETLKATASSAVSDIETTFDQSLTTGISADALKESVIGANEKIISAVASYKNALTSLSSLMKTNQASSTQAGTDNDNSTN